MCFVLGLTLGFFAAWEIWPRGRCGDDLFYTGLKPEEDIGYADFALLAPGEYNVEVSEGSSQVARVMAKPCWRGSHLAWRVVFRKVD